jgi:hypothetical protein
MRWKILAGNVVTVVLISLIAWFLVKGRASEALLQDVAPSVMRSVALLEAVRAQDGDLFVEAVEAAARSAEVGTVYTGDSESAQREAAFAVSQGVSRQLATLPRRNRPAGARGAAQRRRAGCWRATPSATWTWAATCAPSSPPYARPSTGRRPLRARLHPLWRAGLDGDRRGAGHRARAASAAACSWASRSPTARRATTASASAWAWGTSSARATATRCSRSRWARQREKEELVTWVNSPAAGGESSSAAAPVRLTLGGRSTSRA